MSAVSRVPVTLPKSVEVGDKSVLLKVTPHRRVFS